MGGGGASIAAPSDLGVRAGVAHWGTRGGVCVGPGGCTSSDALRWIGVDCENRREADVIGCCLRASTTGICPTEPNTNKQAILPPTLPQVPPSFCSDALVVILGLSNHLKSPGHLLQGPCVLPLHLSPSELVRLRPIWCLRVVGMYAAALSYITLTRVDRSRSPVCTSCGVL
jgi:hypothetical protein